MMTSDDRTFCQSVVLLVLKQVVSPRRIGCSMARSWHASGVPMGSDTAIPEAQACLLKDVCIAHGANAQHAASWSKCTTE